jgi:cbb3-type cytochrome c oxidase subunit III
MPEKEKKQSNATRFFVIFFVLIIVILFVLLIVAVLKDDQPAKKKSADDLLSGRDYFQQVCSQCHGAAGEGGKGPSLVDDEWLHGGSRDSIIRVITEGVPGKQMVSFSKALSSDEIRELADYVMSLHGQFMKSGEADTAGDSTD